jgi:hypothetical protein
LYTWFALFVLLINLLYLSNKRINQGMSRDGGRGVFRVGQVPYYNVKIWKLLVKSN